LSALRVLEEQQPDLILLDLMMPGMDGFEFVAAVQRHAEWRRIPIIVLTAKDLTEEDRRKLNGQVERVLSKGAFGPEELLSEVRRLVRKVAG
jgi:CheY-like chemotaxis protein